MNLPKNGVAKEIRLYSGALLIFLFDKFILKQAMDFDDKKNK